MRSLFSSVMMLCICVIFPTVPNSEVQHVPCARGCKGRVGWPGWIVSKPWRCKDRRCCCCSCCICKSCCWKASCCVATCCCWGWKKQQKIAEMSLQSNAFIVDSKPFHSLLQNTSTYYLQPKVLPACHYRSQGTLLGVIRTAGLWSNSLSGNSIPPTQTLPPISDEVFTRGLSCRAALLCTVVLLPQKWPHVGSACCLGSAGRSFQTKSSQKSVKSSCKAASCWGGMRNNPRPCSLYLCKACLNY